MSVFGHSNRAQPQQEPSSTNTAQASSQHLPAAQQSTSACQHVIHSATYTHPLHPKSSFSPTQQSSSIGIKRTIKMYRPPPGPPPGWTPQEQQQDEAYDNPLHITTGKNKCPIQRHCRRRRRCRDLLPRRGMPLVTMLVVSPLL